MSKVLDKPLEAPTPSSVPGPREQLTPDQETKYAALLEAVQAVDNIPSSSTTKPSSPPAEVERAWLTRDCLLRYLRATEWNVKESQQRLVQTLSWRREYGIDDFTPEYVSPEQETGKQIILGYDETARPCQYLNPGQQNTPTSPRQVHHLFYMIERVIDLMPPGVEKLNLMVNFKPSPDRSNTNVPIGVAREVLHILQNHYPERLGKALIINVPWMLWGFFKLIRPFMHPVTRDKLKFNEDMRTYVPAEQLWSSDWNGELDFEYDHDTYWPALNNLCRGRREARLARWRAAGAVVGESEDYLAGGTDTSVTGYTYKQKEGDEAVEEKKTMVAEDQKEKEEETVEEKKTLVTKDQQEEKKKEDVTAATTATAVSADAA